MKRAKKGSNPTFFLKYQMDPLSKILGTGYCRFAFRSGVSGLCKARGRRLDILAVSSSSPGTGQFREFMDAAKLEFREIFVWEIWNESLESTLERYGFLPVKTTEPDGEILTGMRWSARKNQTIKPCKQNS